MSVPANLNYLQGAAYTLSIAILPELPYFVQRVNLPGVSINPVMIPNQNVPIPETGDSPTQDDLVVTFKVDEDLVNWFKIRDWIWENGFGEDNNQYKLRKDANTVFSDATLTILSNKRRSNIIVDYKSLFPTSITSVELQNDVSDLPFPISTVSFKYLRYSWREST
jgi:hypothetical protein